MQEIIVREGGLYANFFFHVEEVIDKNTCYLFTVSVFLVKMSFVLLAIVTDSQGNVFCFVMLLNIKSDTDSFNYIPI